MTTSLKDRLAALRAAYPPEAAAHQDRMAAFIDRIAQFERRAAPGSQAPDFTLPSDTGRLVSLSDLLDGGPLVLVFVRGAWCPFCSAQIAALAETADEFAAAGIGIAIVTPEIGGRAKALSRESGAPFAVLADVDMGVALAFGCLIPLPKDERDFLAARGVDLAAAYGNDGHFMPIASAFGIAADGTIVTVFGETDARARPEPSEMLARTRSALTAAQS